MTTTFEDLPVRELVDLLTEEEQRELRPAVLRVLGRLPQSEILRRELGHRLTNA